MNIDVDVIIYDTVGMPYIGQTPDHASLGGSEFSAIQVAEGFAGYNLKVTVLNNVRNDVTHNGVRYLHHSMSTIWSISCKLLLVQRYTPVPTHIKYDKLVLVLHDKPDDAAIKRLYTYTSAVPVFVSNWQKSLYPDILPGVVIPNIIPDRVYNTEPNKVKGRFIYASAASRGLKESLRLWECIKGYASDIELFCCAPSYDPIQGTLPEVTELGSISFPDLVYQLSMAEGLFYAHNNPETFCIVAAVAEALGCRVHALGLNGLGALPEVIDSKFLSTNRFEFVRDFLNNIGSTKPVTNRKYYGSSAIMPKWMELYNE